MNKDLYDKLTITQNALVELHDQVEIQRKVIVQLLDIVKPAGWVPTTNEEAKPCRKVGFDMRGTR